MQNNANIQYVLLLYIYNFILKTFIVSHLVMH